MPPVSWGTPRPSAGRTRLRWASVVAGVLLLAAGLTACTRAGQQQVEIGAAAGQSQPSAPASGGSGASPITQAIARGDFGPLKALCGPAPSGEKNTASDQGVTPTSVEVGTFSDPGSAARPGLDQELFDASEVFTAWCNQQGGINGRQIKLNEHDSALFNYEPQMIKACQTDFFLAGGGAVFDDAGQKTRLQCLLPDIPAIQTTSQSIGSDLAVQVNPEFLDRAQFELAPYLSATFPDSISKVGVLTGNLSTTVLQANIFKTAGEHFGWKFTYSDQYNAEGESTWVPYAQKIAQAGLKGLLFIGEPVDLGLLVQALAQINYKLDWIASVDNMYDQKLTSTAGAALNEDPVYVSTNFSPYELESQSPALQEYEALFAQYKPKGLSHALLGQLSFSAWLLFADAAKACGGDLTRACVYNKAVALDKDWDGGGLSSNGADCAVNIKATGSGFTVIPYKANDDFWNCNPNNVVSLPHPIGPGTTLSDVGKSLKDLK
jgi:ABC-type branched-subunit amino acid transport system substrate-binding protein